MNNWLVPRTHGLISLVNDNHVDNSLKDILVYVYICKELEAQLFLFLFFFLFFGLALVHWPVMVSNVVTR